MFNFVKIKFAKKKRQNMHYTQINGMKYNNKYYQNSKNLEINNGRNLVQT